MSRSTFVSFFVLSILPSACSGTTPAESERAAESTSGAPIHDVTGLCLDVTGADSTNGSRIQLWDCHGGDNQQWTYAGGALVGFDGKCLDVQWGNSANGTPVQLWDCNGTAAQQWTFDAGRLVSALGKCLDVPASHAVPGQALQIWDCHGGSNQLFSLDGTPEPEPKPDPEPPTTTDPDAWFEGFDGNNSGKFDNSWGYTPAITYHDGILRIEGPSDRSGYDGQAGVMGLTGAPDSWFAYGLYEFRIRYEGGLGDGSGPAVGLWAADNRWPDGEIDMGEIDSSGRLYYAQHWDPDNKFNLYYPDVAVGSVDWTQWHTTAVKWEPGGALTFYLDGKVIATDWARTPAAKDGGVNRIPFTMNRSRGTVMECDWIRYTPLH